MHIWTPVSFYVRANIHACISSLEREESEAGGGCSVLEGSERKERSEVYCKFMSFDREMNGISERLERFRLDSDSLSSSQHEMIDRADALQHQRTRKRRNKRKGRKPQRHRNTLPVNDDERRDNKLLADAEARHTAEDFFGNAPDELKLLTVQYFYYEACCKKNHGHLRPLPDCHRDLYRMAHRHVQQQMPRERNERYSQKLARKMLMTAYIRYISCLRYHRLR